MKKVVSWIKKISLMVGVFFVSMWSKVWARMEITPMYGSPELDEHYRKVDMLDTFDRLLDLLRFLIIPLIFIIGIIVYLKKSSNSKIRKIITILIALFLLMLLLWGIGYIKMEISGY